MDICAGTSKGVFALGNGTPRQVLESRGVRELVGVGGRCFAGTGDGLFVSDDCGRTWRASGLEGREVWQVRDDGEGNALRGHGADGVVPERGPRR